MFVCLFILMVDMQGLIARISKLPVQLSDNSKTTHRTPSGNKYPSFTIPHPQKQRLIPPKQTLYSTCKNTQLTPKAIWFDIIKHNIYYLCIVSLRCRRLKWHHYCTTKRTLAMWNTSAGYLAVAYRIIQAKCTAARTHYASVLTARQ